MSLERNPESAEPLDWPTSVSLFRHHARDPRGRSFNPLTGENTVKSLLVRLWKEEEGQDLTEYALLLVLLVLAAIGSLSTLAIAVNGVFVNAASNLSNPT